MTVETRRSDITQLRAGDLAGATLVTASALLDLLTAEELARAASAPASAPDARRCSPSRSSAGSSSSPPIPLDAASPPRSTPTSAATAAGRLLGPDAVAAAAEAFRRRGAEVLVRPSPWRLGPPRPR